MLASTPAEKSPNQVAITTGKPTAKDTVSKKPHGRLLSLNSSRERRCAKAPFISGADSFDDDIIKLYLKTAVAKASKATKPIKIYPSVRLQKRSQQSSRTWLVHHPLHWPLAPPMHLDAFPFQHR